jgi:hypothetical protein
MASPLSERRRQNRSIRVPLTAEQAEALEHRARRNDRFDWSEARRIIREALVRDGDLPAEPPAGNV